MKDALQKILSKQFLITSFIEQKLRIVNYIKEGYDDNMPILINNSFMHFTAHIYYRSIVVDLYALFGDANNHNKYSLFQNAKKFKELFNDNTVETIESKLAGYNVHIEIIRELRHQQIAHYNFEQYETIKLNFNDLEVMNDLYTIAKEIISFYGISIMEKERAMSFGFEKTSLELNALKRLIEKAARP